MGITIPTTELIGGISDVLPQISDPKHSSTAGVEIYWDGDALHFTTYDTFSGATVAWVPGEGAEGEISEEEDGVIQDVAWGGEDEPWRVFIWFADAKEILKLFNLPAKLWRFPVTIKVNDVGTKLIVERTDSPRGERLLVIPTDNDVLRQIPDVRAIALALDRERPEGADLPVFANTRLGAFGGVRWHGSMALILGGPDEPVGIRMGSRFHGFIYRAGAKAKPFNHLRNGEGLANSGG